MSVSKGSWLGRWLMAGVAVTVGWLAGGVAVAQLKPAKEPVLSAEERALAVRKAERQEWVDQAVGRALSDFNALKLSGDQLAVTLVEWREGEVPVTVGYRGGVEMEGGGVERLFYMVAAEHELEDGKLRETGELKRSLRGMMTERSDEATGEVVDLVTGTKSGPELPAAEMERWHERREVVNRYFAFLGYKGINVNKKPWSAKPYGREAQAMGLYQPTRNLLTTEAMGRLMKEIFTGKVVSPARCEIMKSFMQRKLRDKSENRMGEGFIGVVLPEEAKLWLVEGLTEKFRNDAAYMELPNGEKFVLVIFTVEHANESNILGNIVRDIIRELGKEG